MKRTIREYEPGDVDSVLECWEAGVGLAHPFLSESFFQQERQNIRDTYLPNAETWVIEEAGKVIGFIALIGENEVGGLFVRPQYHGTGAGKSLMDKARALRGPLEVEVFEANTMGMQFYDRYGFELDFKKIHPPTGETICRLKLPA